MHVLFFETLAIGLGTYVIRAGSLSLGSRVRWPAWAKNGLSFVTPAVLGALIGPELFMPGGHIGGIGNATLLAAIPTAAVAWFSRNLLWTVGAGVLVFALISAFV